MTDDRADELLNALRRELSIEPSAQFAARVRANVDGRSAKHRLSLWWMTLPVAIAGLVVVVLWPKVNTNPAQAPMPSVAASNTTRVGEPPQTVEPLRPRSAPEPTVPARRMEQGKSVADGSSIDATVAAEPEVLVPADQEQALRRLLTAFREGRGTVPPVSAEAAAQTRELPGLQPISVEPIQIQLLPGSQPGGGRNTP